jgi:hypothetical protein
MIISLLTIPLLSCLPLLLPTDSRGTVNVSNRKLILGLSVFNLSLSVLLIH